MNLLLSIGEVNKQHWEKENTGIEEDETYGENKIVGEVFLDNISVNLWMVKHGYVWNFTKYTTEKEYYNAEINAQEKRLGLWKEDAPIKPSVFRAARKKKK